MARKKTADSPLPGVATLRDPLEEIFLCDIIASPSNDALRLIYADWLDEQGDPHSELIRVQCRLTSDGLDPAERDSLYHREQQLLRENEERWLGPRIKLGDVSFERGFLRRCQLPYLLSGEEAHRYASQPIFALLSLAGRNLWDWQDRKS